MTNTPQKIVAAYGADILTSDGMRAEKRFIQHGSVSVYAHSFAVAVCAVRLALWYRRFFPWSRRLRIRSLVRGALLHDYFLYDWHVPAKWHRLHGFHHAARAYRNAKRDFALNALEENMIRAHMFPLGIVVPRYRESWILWTADKICALRETIRR